MPELQFMSVTKAFNHIGARTASGELYETVRRKSMSADKRHFRFSLEIATAYERRFVKITLHLGR